MAASITPSAQELEEQICSELVTRFGVDRATITLDATFEGLGLDSLAVVELSDVLQGLLQVPVADDDLNGEQKIAEVVALMQEKLTEPEGIEKPA